MYVDNCNYDICNKMVILAYFKATLLETTYMVCGIVNKRLLNVKNRADWGPNKTHPSGMSK